MGPAPLIALVIRRRHRVASSGRHVAPVGWPVSRGWQEVTDPVCTGYWLNVIIFQLIALYAAYRLYVHVTIDL